MQDTLKLILSAETSIKQALNINCVTRSILVL